MHLVIDIGNTCIKKAIFDGNKIVAFDHEEQYPITHAIVSASGNAEVAVPEGVAVHKLTAQSRLPITLGYKTPQTLGTDRIADACGAWKVRGGKGCVIVDAGTCITIDYIDEQGVYQGGAILPGLDMRFRALHDYTARLPLVDYQEPCGYQGKSTEECIIAGVVTATQVEVAHFVNHYCKNYGAEVVLTGGDANRMNMDLTLYEPHLGLIGLNEILHLNK